MYPAYVEFRYYTVWWEPFGWPPTCMTPLLLPAHLTPGVHRGPSGSPRRSPPPTLPAVPPWTHQSPARGRCGRNARHVGNTPHNCRAVAAGSAAGVALRSHRRSDRDCGTAKVNQVAVLAYERKSRRFGRPAQTHIPAQQGRCLYHISSGCIRIIWTAGCACTKRQPIC